MLIVEMDKLSKSISKRLQCNKTNNCAERIR